MKGIMSLGKRVVCLFIALAILVLTASCGVAGKTNKTSENFEANEYEKQLEEEMDVEVVKNDETVTCIYSQDNCEMIYNSENGELYFTDKDGTFPLEITDVSDEGVISWRINKGIETLEGEVNTCESPTPQFAVAIAGTSYLVYTFVYYVVKTAVVVTIAGATCYLANTIADTLKKNSKKYNYFPAYNMFGNVYVATAIGLTKSKAVSRIRNGSHVWANSENYAWSACVSASPIGAAEWGWHGNRQVESGYYRHYHAVRYYKADGKYVHTGAHCWYM